MARRQPGAAVAVAGEVRGSVAHPDSRRDCGSWRTLSTAQVGIGEGLRLALKLSLATGQRIGAVAMALETDVELDGSDDPELADAGPTWLIRGESGAKAKRDRLLPLSPLAVTLFSEALALPGREPGGAVFRGKSSGSHLTQPSISRPWGMLRRAGKAPNDTTPHDLRRTAQKHLARVEARSAGGNLGAHFGARGRFKD